ncbi:T9SS type A sorting domain-containing protein [Pedobacter glucosidilyticus]|uniref:T9SS type A sorting domain-containing protein n=1 Tax=Pedobacter glucosidilyticus TaxID=1122941 RepID=UPI0026E95C26|nr:T9SS type A sorting domain-containing protein [Pedobacter glucosidilyticus]
MKKTLLISALACYFGIKAHAQTTLFSQNFNSSAVLTDYYNVSPTTNQFDNIVSGNPTNAAISINNNALRLVKTGAFNGGANTFYAIRSTAIGSGSNLDLVQYKFDYTVSNITTISTTGIPNYHFLVGSSVTNDAAAVNYHSKVTITHTNTTTAPFTWYIANNNTSNTLYSGTQTITLIANNSGAVKSYIAPDGSTTSVANDAYDIWVGTTLEVNDLAALNTGDILSKFKFGLPANTLAATFDVDNIVVTSLPTTLPISLTSFTAKAVDKNILLNWTTASEENNDYFEIQHSANGKSFTTIGKLNGAGTSKVVKDYSFTDENPFAGTNYYKLIQHDFDGKTSEFITSASSKIAASQLSAYATSTDVNITLSSPNNTKGKLQLFDISGRKLSETTVDVNKGYNTFSLPSTLQSGIHILRYTTESEIINQKFLR